MKNTFLILPALVLLNFTTFAQWINTGTRIINDPLTYNVGIGTSKPSYLLEVVGSTNPAISLNNSGNESFKLGISSCNGCFLSNVNIGDGVLQFVGDSKNFIISHLGGSSTSGGIIFKTGGVTADEKPRMEITKTGKILIGLESKNCSLPTDGILGVNGTIYATKVKVRALSAGCFPDYVFEKDYKLRSLNEVERFINKNKHLPEIPSAEEMEKSDVDVAEMDALLLKKIEELTLYMIDLKKENEGLKKDKNLLQSQIKDIYKKLNK